MKNVKKLCIRVRFIFLFFCFPRELKCHFIYFLFSSHFSTKIVDHFAYITMTVEHAEIKAV